MGQTTSKNILCTCKSVFRLPSTQNKSEKAGHQVTHLFPNQDTSA